MVLAPDDTITGSVRPGFRSKADAPNVIGILLVLRRRVRIIGGGDNDLFILFGQRVERIDTEGQVDGEAEVLASDKSSMTT